MEATLPKVGVAAPERTAPLTLESRRYALVIGAALVAFVIKLAIAYQTFGSNDVVTFYHFSHALTKHGLGAVYQNDINFNHPPLTSYYLRAIFWLAHQPFCTDYNITFPFLLRLPGIIGDFVVVMVIAACGRFDSRLRLPLWALLLLALSPVSLMISGFHGNTDSVMVMFLVLAAYACLRDKAWLCGLFLALSCQVKIVPLLFAPVFFLFWFSRGRIVSFLVPFALSSLALWAEPLFQFPLAFIKNVISYGSFWGLWGITYWLRLTQLPMFSMVTFFNFPPAQFAVVTALKLFIIAAVLMLAFRRRFLDGAGVFHSLAFAWIVFFVFSPGVCAQYMVWLAPFVLLLSPTFYGWVTATSSVFLFFFYNITAGGLPWYLAISTNKLNTVWTPWSVWPWAALVIGMVLLWKKSVAAHSGLRLFSLKALNPAPRE